GRPSRPSSGDQASYLTPRLPPGARTGGCIDKLLTQARNSVRRSVTWVTALAESIGAPSMGGEPVAGPNAGQGWHRVHRVCTGVAELDFPLRCSGHVRGSRPCLSRPDCDSGCAVGPPGDRDAVTFGR